MGKKEDFLESWMEAVQRAMPEMDAEQAEKSGNELWMGREIGRAVVEDDGFNILAHRYFHGIGSVRLQLLMMSGIGIMMPILMGEHMFSLGFMCGVANERGVVNVDDVANLEDAIACMEGREGVLKTRADIEQEDALPSIPSPFEDALPEGFAGTHLRHDDEEEEGGGYF